MIRVGHCPSQAQSLERVATVEGFAIEDAIDIVWIGLIGTGAAATIWAARVVTSDGGESEETKSDCGSSMLRDDDIIAVKTMKRSSLSLRESEILRNIDHPFIARQLFCASPPDLNQVMIGLEYCCGGDLFERMCSTKFACRDIRLLGSQVASALEYLGERGIIHGDIKPENIVLDGEGFIRLIDFGLALQLDEQRSKVVTSSGTLAYSPPEILKRLPHGCETDWWSFAVMLFELMHECLPWDLDHLMDSDAVDEICRKICFEPLDDMTSFEDIELASLHFVVAGCLEKDPKHRISPEILVKTLKSR